MFSDSWPIMAWRGCEGWDCRFLGSYRSQRSERCGGERVLKLKCHHCLHNDQNLVFNTKITVTNVLVKTLLRMFCNWRLETERFIWGGLFPLCSDRWIALLCYQKNQSDCPVPAVSPTPWWNLLKHRQMSHSRLLAVWLLWYVITGGIRSWRRGRSFFFFFALWRSAEQNSSFVTLCFTPSDDVSSWSMLSSLASLELRNADMKEALTFCFQRRTKCLLLWTQTS